MNRSGVRTPEYTLFHGAEERNQKTKKSQINEEEELNSTGSYDERRLLSVSPFELKLITDIRPFSLAFFTSSTRLYKKLPLRYVDHLRDR